MATIEETRARGKAIREANIASRAVAPVAPAPVAPIVPVAPAPTVQ